MSFDEFPKSIKEEIWSYLDEKEFYNLRKVCKDWKKDVETPKSLLLKERYENGKKISEKWLSKRKKFYEGFILTSRILTSTHISIGLDCCYGRVLVYT